MRTRRRLSGLIALPLLAAFALSGCATAEPVAVPSSPSNSPSTTPTPTAEPVAAVVEVAGTGLSVVDSTDALITSVLYSADPQTAIDALTEAFGSSPALSVRPSDENCVPEANVATWPEGFVLRYGMPETTTPPGQLFEVDATAASVGPVAVETPGGVRVGDPYDTLAAGVPAEQIMETGETDLGLVAWVHYEVGSGTPAPANAPELGSRDYWGASARSIDGVVERLTAPVALQGVC